MARETLEVPSLDVQWDALQVISDVRNKVVAQETFWVEGPNDQSTVSAAMVDNSLELNVMKGRLKNCIVNRHDILLEYEENKRFKANFGRPMVNFQCPIRSNITCLDVTRDEQLAVIGDSEGGLKILDINESGELRRDLAGHLVYTTVAKFFPSGQVILSAGSDMQIKIWSAANGSNPRTLVGHTATINCIEIIGRGRNIISGSKDGTVRLWECGSAQTVRTLQLGSEVTSIALLGNSSSTNSTALERSPLEFETDGKSLVVSNALGVYLWDIRDSEMRANPIDSNSGSISTKSSHELATDGYEVAVSDSDGLVCIYDTRKLSEPSYSVARPKNDRSPIKSLHLSNHNLTVLDRGTCRLNLGKPEDITFFADQYSATCISAQKSSLYSAGPFGISQHQLA